jgi:hypothetical protein
MPEEETNYQLSELETLGLRVSLNEFNDKKEILNLFHLIRQKLYKKYKRVYSG